MKVVEYEIITRRDGKKEEIKLIELAPLCWEAWGKIEGEKEWHCNSPHTLTSDIVEDI